MNEYKQVYLHLLIIIIYWIHGHYTLAFTTVTHRQPTIYSPIVLRSTERTIEITQPSSRHDFFQLSDLIVSTFDNPLSSLYHEQQDNIADKEGSKAWSDEDQQETVRHTMIEYLKNVKKMQGYKYALWIARECSESPTDGKQDEGKIVGVVEVGLTQAKPNRSLEKSLSNTDRMSDSGKRPTIGVLCVDPAYRSMGIATALIETCESLIVKVWNEKSVYVQVEPWNIQSLRFFEKQGYQLLHSKKQKDDSIHQVKEESTFKDWKNIDPSDIIMVRLYRNRVLKDIPHVLMVKKLHFE